MGDCEQALPGLPLPVSCLSEALASAGYTFPGPVGCLAPGFGHQKALLEDIG